MVTDNDRGDSDNEPDSAWRAAGAVTIGSRWRHRKRGTIYTIVGLATLQANASALDGATVAIYRCDHSAKQWVRPISEFAPDRFELVSPTLETTS